MYKLLAHSNIDQNIRLETSIGRSGGNSQRENYFNLHFLLRKDKHNESNQLSLQIPFNFLHCCIVQFKIFLQIMLFYFVN